MYQFILRDSPPLGLVSCSSLTLSYKKLLLKVVDFKRYSPTRLDLLFVSSLVVGRLLSPTETLGSNSPLKLKLIELKVKFLGFRLIILI